MKRRFRILLVLLFFTLIGAFITFRILKQAEIGAISNFDECEASHYPISEMYPPRCSTPDGRTFTKDIGNELEYADLIRVETPRPNAVIKSPLIIKGEARGSWFWEANSTAELYDANGKSIGAALVLAKGEWMTSDFVPFEGIMEFEKTEPYTGKLILRNDNPSGLPENQKELIIPVSFK